MLTTAFAAEWFELEGFFDRPNVLEKDGNERGMKREVISKTEL
jgi:hypothetical protein